MGWCYTVMTAPYLLQLTIMSSGRIRRFSMPILGWSPLPRNKPGGSIRKLAMRSLWLSITQKPYSCRRRSFSSLIFFRWEKESLNRDKTPRYFTNNYFGILMFHFTSFSSLVMAFLASDWALKYSLISEKSHLFRSVILDFSSDVIS